MTVFNDLPTELVDKILGLLSQPKDIMAATTVCKQWRKTLNPIQEKLIANGITNRKKRLTSNEALLPMARNLYLGGGLAFLFLVDFTSLVLNYKKIDKENFIIINSFFLLALLCMKKYLDSAAGELGTEKQKINAMSAKLNSKNNVPFEQNEHNLPKHKYS